MATTISLSDLMAQKGQIPYTKSVKAKVIDTDPEHSYTNERNESHILKNCVIADEGKAVLCVVYDQTKFPRFKEGSSVILRNVIKKPDGVAVTSNTKVFPCAEVSVPEHIVNQAKNLLHPPPAPTKTVSEALNSPPKERVSIKGTITQEEATRQVFVREESVNVKNIYIEDATSKCKVALWRSFAEKDIRPGDYVHITDVVINTFRNEVSLTTTSKTKITKTDCPPEVKVKHAVSGCVDGENMTFLLEDDTILTMPLELVEVALPNVEKEEIESYVISRCNPMLSIRCTSKGSSVISIEFL